MKKVNFKYVSYKGVVSNTVPGRCYSISELLQRVMRGQPFPMTGRYEPDTAPLPTSDEAIELDTEVQLRKISEVENSPDVDRDFDIIEAYNAKASIDEHIELLEESKKKKS